MMIRKTGLSTFTNPNGNGSVKSDKNTERLKGRPTHKPKLRHNESRIRELNDYLPKNSKMGFRQSLQSPSKSLG